MHGKTFEYVSISSILTKDTVCLLKCMKGEGVDFNKDVSCIYNFTTDVL